MKRHDPGILKIYGLTEAEADNPGEALLSAGVQKLFNVVQYMKLPLDLDAAGAATSPEFSTHPLNACRGAKNEPPLWQTLTGLFPHTASTMAPEKREEALETLLSIVLRLLRFEMNAERQAPNAYHTVYWDPLPKICLRLGIAKSELSRLAKEGSGLAAHELVDVVRVKGVKEKMKEQARTFIEALKTEKDAPSTALGIYYALKKARSGPQFHRGQWALTFGFPNYARFYRACLVFYQLAPQQLELMAIEEVLAEMAGADEQTRADSGGDVEACERMKKVVWEELKGRHVQFFAENSGKGWAAAG